MAIQQSSILINRSMGLIDPCHHSINVSPVLFPFTSQQRQVPGDLVAAAGMIVALKLQSSYDFAYVVAPLILTDKMQLVDAFVGKDDDLRMQLVSLFDQWASFRTHKLTEFIKGLGLDPCLKGA